MEELVRVSGVADIHRLDRELDHLRALGMIDGGFAFLEFASAVDTVNVTPTALALHMYVRCQGVRLTPGEFFGVRTTTSEDSA